jgi:hypothetical protein
MRYQAMEMAPRALPLLGLFMAYRLNLHHVLVQSLLLVAPMLILGLWNTFT